MLKENVSESYKDPENVEEIISELKECQNYEEVINLIKKTFPNWILGFPKRYCTDYPHFQNNWKFICNKTNCKPLTVIIVEYVVFEDNNFRLLKMFSELLTIFGHSVRRKNEFIGCKICGDAIPNQYIYNQLVERCIPTPSCWMIKCSNC